MKREQNTEICVELLRNAFRDAAKPEGSAIIGVNSVNALGLIERWAAMSREEVENISSFDINIGADLLYMSSSALRYYLPSLMVGLMLNPRRFDEFGLDYLLTRLEQIVGTGKAGKNPYPVYFTPLQMAAIHSWLEWLSDRLRLFVSDDVLPDFNLRLSAVATSFSAGGPLKDFDIEGRV